MDNPEAGGDDIEVPGDAKLLDGNVMETHRPSPKVAVDIARESGPLCVTVCS